MGTQGLVSIVHGSQVRAKLICGCNGYEAPKLAAKIREAVSLVGMLDLDTLNRMAMEIGFGCDACLVTMGPDAVSTYWNEDLSPLYRDKFNEPRFNPRWEHGTADYVEVVEL